MDDYFSMARAHLGPQVRLGLEVDSDHAGRPLLCPEDRERTDLILGAIHSLSSLDDEDANEGKVCVDFLATMARFLPTGMHVLAHPFRVFRRAGMPRGCALPL